jgi:hypothetical protein
MSIANLIKISSRIFKGVGVFLVGTILLFPQQACCQEVAKRTMLFNRAIEKAADDTAYLGAQGAIVGGIISFPFIPVCLCAPFAGGVIGFIASFIPRVFPISILEVLPDEYLSCTNGDYDEFFSPEGIVSLEDYKVFLPEMKMLLLIHKRKSTMQFPKQILQKIMSYRVLTEKGLYALGITDTRLENIDSSNSLRRLLQNLNHLEQLSSQHKIAFKNNDCLGISCNPCHFDKKIIENDEFKKMYPAIARLAGPSKLTFYIASNIHEEKEALIECYQFENDPTYNDEKKGMKYE